MLSKIMKLSRGMRIAVFHREMNLNSSKEIRMKRLLITSMIVALPLAVSCDRGNRQEENVGTGMEQESMQQEEKDQRQQEEADQGKVMDESSGTNQQQSEEIPQQEVEKGSAQEEGNLQQQE
jgi:hypothetical protein